MPTCRRSLGDTLYSIYLGILAVGSVAVLSMDDAGEYGAASDGGRTVLAVGAVTATVLHLGASTVGRVPIFVDLPTVLHTARRSAPLGWSLRASMIGRMWLVALVATCVAIGLQRPLSADAEGAVRFVGCAAFLAVAVGGAAVGAASGALCSRIVSWLVGAASAATAVVAVRQDPSSATVAVGAALAVFGVTIALAGLESIPVERIVDRARVLYSVMPRIYLMTPSDIHRAAHGDGPGFRTWRRPIDGRIGMLRAVMLGVLIAATLQSAPATGFGYPLVAGAVAYVLGLDVVSALRGDVLFADRSPRTLPDGHTVGSAFRYLFAGLFAVGIGAALSSSEMPVWIAVGIATGGTGVLAACLSALARELRFADLLLDGGPEVLGMVIASRLVGPAALSMFGSAGLHAWVVRGERSGLFVLTVTIVVVAVIGWSMVRHR